MTEENTPQGMDQQSSEESAASETAAPEPRQKSGGGAIGALALIIALAAAGGSGYVWYQQRSSGDNMTASLDKVVGESAKQQQEQQQKLSDLGASLNSVKTETNQEIAALGDKQGKLEDALKKVYVDISNNREVWMLEEVDQLLTAASQRLLLANDKYTALEALKQADKQLASLGDPALLPVREIITKDIATISSMGVDDVAGVALKIRNVMQSVDELPFDYDPKVGRPGGKDEATSANAQPTEKPAAAGGRMQILKQRLVELGDEVGSDLLDLIKVRPLGHPAPPLLPPDEKYFAIGNVKLSLGAAQMALLQGNETVYTENLKQAGQWLRTYFAKDNAAVENAANTLDELSRLDVSPDWPDLGAALKQLRVIMEQKAAQ